MGGGAPHSLNSSRVSGEAFRWCLTNARIHRRRVLLPLFVAAGIELKFRPAYCPEYNPIETAFAWNKARVRSQPRQALRNVAAVTLRAVRAVPD